VIWSKKFNLLKKDIVALSTTTTTTTTTTLGYFNE